MGSHLSEVYTNALPFSKEKRADSIEEYDSAHMEAVITRNSPALPGQEEVAIVNQRLDSIDCAMKEIDPKYAEVITLWVTKYPFPNARRH